MGALSYADNITQQLNGMLEICIVFAISNFITFNTSKSVCIKYGEPVRIIEQAMLNDYFNCQLNNNVDRKHKCSHFIGYFKKLLGNFG